MPAGWQWNRDGGNRICAGRILLPQAAKGIWRKPEDGMEHAGEVKRIAEPHLFGHLFHQRAVLLQSSGGVVYFEAEQILVG